MESKVFDTSGKRIWVAGHRGMVGAAIVRRLATAGCEILTVGREEVDLTRQADVERWLDKARPDAIVMAAARVGGIHANSTLPADFLFINLMIGANVVNAAHRAGVKRLVYAGSSSVYGDTPTLPKTEDMPPNPLSPYALQKLVAEQYCRMFTTLYGFETVTTRYFNVFGPRQDPGSPYSGVISLFSTAVLDGRQPIIYGDGTQTMDFVHVHDIARANVTAAKCDVTDEVFNVASGTETSLRELAALLAKETRGIELAQIH